MATTTVASLITRIKQRTDNEHSGSEFVTDDELVGLINTSYARLVGLLATAGIHFDETEQTVCAYTLGAWTYTAFSADFFALIGVYRVDSAGRYHRLKRHDSRDHVQPAAVRSGISTSYRVKNRTVELIPRPAQDTYVATYIPKVVLSSGSSVVSVGGWDEYIVVDVSAKIRQKEQQLQDAALLKQDVARIEAEIREEAVAQEMNETVVVQTSRRSLDDTLADLESDEFDYKGLRGWR